MKKVLLLLLVCAMLIPCLAACGNKTEKGSSQTTNYWNGDNGDSLYDADGYLKDSIPSDLKYNNEEIKILYWNNGELGQGEFDPGEDAGSTIERAVYSRNMATEDRLNVSLNWKGIAGAASDRDAFISTVTTAFAGGDETRFDLIGGYSQNMADLAVRGLTLDLMTTSKYLDLGKPWWPDSLVNDMTVSGKLYFASGDISTTFIGTMLSVYINKDYYPDENLYDLVYNDQWTLETMYEMIKNQRLDRGTPEVKDLEDKFGLIVAWTSYLDGFFYGSNLITTDHDSTTGKLRVSRTYIGEKADTLCETLKTLFRSEDAWMPDPDDPFSTHVGAVELFARGDAAMMVGTGTTILAYQSMLDTDVEYAVLPMPKYNENQKEYKTVNLNLYTLWSIFSGCNVAQGERAGAVMECLASMGYRTVTPVLFDTCLKLRYAKDGDTGKMYDIIRAGVVFDPGRVFASGALESITQNNWQRSVIWPDKTWGAQSAAVDTRLQQLLDNLSKSFES